MTFGGAREFARAFLGALGKDETIQREIVAAIEETLARYDTGPWENRFVVGGVVEQVVGSAARALGLPVNNAGARRQRYDLEIRPGYGVSVKAQFGPYSRSSRIRLTNSQGGAGEWATGTLFVHTGLGIGYADRGLAPEATLVSGDGKSLDVALIPLLHLWGVEPRLQKGPPPKWLAALGTPDPQPGYFVSLPIPDRPAQAAPRLFSDPTSLDIFSGARTPRLREHFQWSI